MQHKCEATPRATQQLSSQCAKMENRKPEIINAIKPTSKKTNKQNKKSGTLDCILFYLTLIQPAYPSVEGGSPALQMGQVASWLCLLRQK